MRGDADRAPLIGDRARDRPPNPPDRVGREFVTKAMFEFIDRFHQSDIAFLNQVEELQAAFGVVFGDENNEPQIGLDHFLLGFLPFAIAFLGRLGDAPHIREW